MKTDSFKVTKGNDVIATVKFTYRPGLGYSARFDQEGDRSAIALHPYGVGDTPWAAVDSLMDHVRVRPMAHDIEQARLKLKELSFH